MKEISVQPVRFGGQQHIVEPFVTIKEIAPTFLLGNIQYIFVNLVKQKNMKFNKHLC